MTPRTVLVAPDSFKGSLTSVEVARALGNGWLRARPSDTVLLSPLADGGEGTLVAVEAAGGWEWQEVAATDPIDRPVRARWLRSSDGRRAVVELAEASGLSRLTTAERDPTGRRGWRLASALVAGGLALLLVRPGLWSVVAGLALFFAGFNVLEARLPAEISRRSDASRRGASLSVFATAQLLGAFAGGACGVLLLGAGGPRGVFGAGTVVALAGVLLAAAATRRVAPVPAGG